MDNRHLNLILRSKTLYAIRGFFISQGFIEVETPYRIPANAPEEHIFPIKSENLFLQTSPEISMKRLLARGYDKIFQISHCWRAGERGKKHLTEFTMLEWYRANSDYNSLMHDCESLLQFISETVVGKKKIKYKGTQISFENGVAYFSVRDAFLRFANTDMENAVKNDSFDELMVTLIEPLLPKDRPSILMDYPVEYAALSRNKANDCKLAERFELYAGGLEIANGFSELNDPHEQRTRFTETNHKIELAGRSPLPLPESFLNELDKMPPSAGIALGVDRLVMLFADTENIDDVVTFTSEEL